MARFSENTPFNVYYSRESIYEGSVVLDLILDEGESIGNLNVDVRSPLDHVTASPLFSSNDDVAVHIVGIPQDTVYSGIIYVDVTDAKGVTSSKQVIVHAVEEDDLFPAPLLKPSEHILELPKDSVSQINIDASTIPSSDDGPDRFSIRDTKIKTSPPHDGDHELRLAYRVENRQPSTQELWLRIGSEHVAGILVYNLYNTRLGISKTYEAGFIARDKLSTDLTLPYFLEATFRYPSLLSANDTPFEQLLAQPSAEDILVPIGFNYPVDAPAQSAIFAGCIPVTNVYSIDHGLTYMVGVRPTDPAQPFTIIMSEGVITSKGNAKELPAYTAEESERSFTLEPRHVPGWTEALASVGGLPTPPEPPTPLAGEEWTPPGTGHTPPLDDETPPGGSTPSQDDGDPQTGGEVPPHDDATPPQGDATPEDDGTVPDSGEITPEDDKTSPDAGDKDAPYVPPKVSPTGFYSSTALFGILPLGVEGTAFQSPYGVSVEAEGAFADQLSGTQVLEMASVEDKVMAVSLEFTSGSGTITLQATLNARDKISDGTAMWFPVGPPITVTGSGAQLFTIAYPMSAIRVLCDDAGATYRISTLRKT